MNIFMQFCINTEKVSKVGVETMRKILGNDIIAYFVILSYAYNMLPYASVVMVCFMLMVYIILILLQ